MSDLTPKQDFQHRTILQADKLITTACENRRMLLEYDQEVLPFAIRVMLKKQPKEYHEIEAYLDKIFESESLQDEKQGLNPQETHAKFFEASTALIAVANHLNQALTVDNEIKN